MKIEVTANPNEQDDNFVIDRTREFNTQFVENSFELISVYARDEDQNIIAGLTGKTYWDWLHVEYLWVDENNRVAGLGSSLMLAAEAEAIERGCVGSMLDTFSFQAPDFYLKLGYESFGELANYAGSHNRYFMRKAFNRTHFGLV